MTISSILFFSLPTLWCFFLLQKTCCFYFNFTSVFFCVILLFFSFNAVVCNLPLCVYFCVVYKPLLSNISKRKEQNRREYHSLNKFVFLLCQQLNRVEIFHSILFGNFFYSWLFWKKLKLKRVIFRLLDREFFSL